MTDSQRNCFLAVAEHRSFSRAAAALYVSQPAVSKNISTLEAEMGSPLFDRQGKFVALTKAGEIFLSFLTEYQREFDNMIERIRSLDSSAFHGVVKIGCILIWNAGHFYVPLSKHLADNFPGVQLEVVGLEPEALLSALRRKEVDLVIMYGYEGSKLQDIEIRPLTKIGSGFLCSSKLLGSAHNLAALAEHPFLIAENSADRRNSGIYKDLIKTMLGKHGFVPKYTGFRSLASAMVDLSCGKGSLLTDEWVAGKSNSELIYISSGERVPLCIASLRNNPDTLTNLVIDETLKLFGNDS